VRVAIQALAAVLGGTQSLHANSFDEALALPTQRSATLALRTQQLLANETGVPDVVDPLGGSWYLESLTDQIERDARKLIDEIDAGGGAVQAIERGFFQEAIARSAYEQQREVEAGKRGARLYQARRGAAGTGDGATEKTGRGNRATDAPVVGKCRSRC
jgi:methylmalonyl-CoA mutase N-terminal domain/subunit